MATTNLSFEAQVDAWTRQTKERMEAVFKESAQRVVSLAVSYTPVDSGFLRASVQGSLSAMPQINPMAKRGSGLAGRIGDITLTIVGAQLGQTIYVGYTAAYAAHVEYGTSRMAPRRFVGRAAAQWQSIVRSVAGELQSRASQPRQ